MAGITGDGLEHQGACGAKQFDVGVVRRTGRISQLGPVSRCLQGGELPQQAVMKQQRPPVSLLGGSVYSPLRI